MARVLDTSLPRPEPRFVYVVPALNARHFLEPCLTALTIAAQTRRAAVTIVLVDNGSTDGSVDYVTKHYPHVQVEQRPGVTIGALRNHGAAVVDSDYVGFIDADCVVNADHVERSLDVLEAGHVHATGAVYDLPEDPTRVERVWQRLHHRDVDGPVNYIPSGNLVCRTSAFRSVGGFDEVLSTGEDAELGQRLRHAGFVVASRCAVRAIHLGNAKTVQAFYRKQLWHAEGMFGTARREFTDKPLLLTVLFIASVAAAAGVLVFGRSWSSLGVAAGLLVLSPAVAVAFRAVQHRRVPEIPTALLLYSVYLLARARVLILGPARRPERTAAAASRPNRAASGAARF